MRSVVLEGKLLSYHNSQVDTPTENGVAIGVLLALFNGRKALARRRLNVSNSTEIVPQEWKLEKSCFLDRALYFTLSHKGSHADWR